MRALLLVFALVSVGLLAGSAVALGVTTPRTATQASSASASLVQPLTTVALGTSHGLAGYAVAAVKNVLYLNGAWKIPKVHGGCPASKTEATFVGISLGGYTTTRSAFAGTETFCSSGSPNYVSYLVAGTSAYVATMTVASGDQMDASIYYSNSTNAVTVVLRDNTAGTIVSASAVVLLGKHTDALWVDEAGKTSSGNIVPLVDFGNVTFTKCTATINGTTSPHGVGYYSNTAIEMYDKTNTAFKADIGLITSNNKGFTVKWISTGP